jgi:hypothetical protein
MVSATTKSIVERAKYLYEVKLRQQLEPNEIGRYVAIEPESGDFFIADTFDEAVNSALDRFPDRLTHTIRVGYPAALHLGVLMR